MATATSQAEGAPLPTGFLGSLRGCLGAWVGLLKTRVDIISTEIEEQREWLERLVMLGVASLVLLSFGLVLATLFLVTLLWDNYRLAALGGFSVLYLAGGIIAFLSLRKCTREKPRFFNATMEELEKDHEHLSGVKR